MAVLVKEQILERLRRGELAFSPEIDSLQLQMHAVDLRIGFTFLVPKLWHLSQKGREALLLDHLEPDMKHFDVVELEEGQYFEVLPGEFVVIASLEKVTMPKDLMA